MGLHTIYPKPNLSKPRVARVNYPYLLKNLEIARVNPVWSTDITYLRVKGKGWVYLVAVREYRAACPHPAFGHSNPPLGSAGIVGGPLSATAISLGSTAIKN